MNRSFIFTVLIASTLYTGIRLLEVIGSPPTSQPPVDKTMTAEEAKTLGKFDPRLADANCTP